MPSKTFSLSVVFVTLATQTPLLSGSFREIEDPKRRFSLPSQLATYNQAISQMLERSSIYRRSTAYFDSGVLKLYEEPLQIIVQTEGQIRLLVDWQGFTKRSDVAELEKLHDPSYRIHFVQNTLQEFLQGLEENAFSGTQILAELVRLGFLEIKLIKMDENRALYHKKTGIFSDRLDNHIMHEGSDNFTRAAHSRNTESIVFFYSWEQIDRDTIEQSIQEFDSEWQGQDIAFDLSQEFLHQVLQEYDRRAQQRQPHIEQITPDELTPGETTEVKVIGDNLDKIDTITIPDNNLVEVSITQQTPEEITADFTVSSDHPPQPISDFSIIDKSGEERIVQPKQPPQVSQVKEVPKFDEIEGFQQAIELILSGQYGTPNDFLGSAKQVMMCCSSGRNTKLHQCDSLRI